jgi:hypothetical protein
MADAMGQGLGIGGAVIFIVAGLLVAMFGKTLWKIVVFLIGAIAGGAAAALIAGFIAPIVGQNVMTCSLVAAIVGGIIGGFLALRIVKGILAASVGAIFASIAYALAPGSPLVALIAFLAGFFIALLIMDKLMALLTAMAGGAMVGYGAYMLTGNNIAVLIAVTLVVALFGLYYQFKKHGGDMSRPEESKQKP